jgi:hypothetical protein
MNKAINTITKSINKTNNTNKSNKSNKDSKYIHKTYTNTSMEDDHDNAEDNYQPHTHSHSHANPYSKNRIRGNVQKQKNFSITIGNIPQ